MAVITVSTVFLMSYQLGRCIRVPDDWKDENGVKYGVQLSCPSGGRSSMSMNLLDPLVVIAWCIRMNATCRQKAVIFLVFGHCEFAAVIWRAMSHTGSADCLHLLVAS